MYEGVEDINIKVLQMIQHEHIKVRCCFLFVVVISSTHTVLLHHSTVSQWWNTTGTGSGLVSGSSSSLRRPPTWWKRPRLSRGSVTALWKVSREHPMLPNYMENSDRDFINVGGFMHSGVSVSNLSDNILILHVTCHDIKQKVALWHFFPPKN